MSFNKSHGLHRLYFISFYVSKVKTAEHTILEGKYLKQFNQNFIRRWKK